MSPKWKCGKRWGSREGKWELLLDGWLAASGLELTTFWEHFWSIFALFWGHWPSFWDHWAPLWDHWAPLCPMWGQRIDFRRFLGDSLTPWGIPFSALGVTFSLSGALEAEILCFLGQPGSRSDFGTKCSRISGCLGWLKQWFGVRGVVKITLSPKLEFLRFGASFRR